MGKLGLEQVREALGKVSQDKGKAVARGILTKLDVKSVSDLQPEQFAGIAGGFIGKLGFHDDRAGTVKPFLSAGSA